MPFITNRGRRIHYTVDGAGPLVVFQHGFLSNAQSWHETGFVDALKDRYQVACVDSLAHGESDKPPARDDYALVHRANDLAAVMDALGAEKAHVVGYSMGGWIASGMARHHPQRLASLTVGGWDVVDGAATAAKMMGITDINVELLLASARQTAPELAAWVTPEIEPALISCGDVLLSRRPDTEGDVRALKAPVLLWNGRQDPYHDAMQDWAKANGFAYVSVDGDHLGAMVIHGRAAAAELRAFLDGVA